MHVTPCRANLSSFPPLLMQLVGMSLTFAGAPLKMEAKAKYMARKEEERKNRPAEPEEQV